MFSNTTRTDQLPFSSITEINQERTPPEPSLGGPGQISSRLAEPAGSADSAVMGDVASSFSQSRMLTYGDGQENVSGRGLTPQDSEIDREEATMDLQAVCCRLFSSLRLFLSFFFFGSLAYSELR